MTELEIAFYIILAWINGILLGYICWAPMSSFKQGIMDGLTLKFLWDRKHRERKD